MRLRSFLALSALVTLATGSLAACSSGNDAPAAQTGDEEDAIPAAAKTLYDQSAVCNEILKRHDVVRSIDMKDGSIRWNCGDVPGVSALNPTDCKAKQDALKAARKSGKGVAAAETAVNATCQGYGQEYCEYNAISKGKIVKQISDVAAGAPVQCLFTSVYQDAFTNVAAAGKLATAMADKANSGVAVEEAAVQMQVGFNSRGAATALVNDCRRNGLADAQPSASDKTKTANALINESRQAGCWLSANAAGIDAAKQAKLRTACRGRDLSVQSKWDAAVKLGAKEAPPTDAGYQHEKDLGACLASARSGGVTWRNSDNMICGRVTRAANECSCNYVDIPASFIGFTFSGWTNDLLPAGCRFAKVDAKDYTNLVICELSASERSDLEVDDTYNVDLQGLCHDKFAREIVMKAPIRFLEQPSSCKANAGFCTTYEGK